MIVIRKPTIKNQTITYPEVIEYIKNGFDPSKQIIDVHLSKQEILMGRLLFSLSNREIYEFFINQLATTRAKAYFKAFKDFKNLMEDYFGGTLPNLKEVLNSLEDSDKNITGSDLDSTLFHFRKFRYQFINFLVNRHIESLYNCINRLNNLVISSIEDGEDYDYATEKLRELNKQNIFNLACKVFPEESKTLKVLYGDKK